MNLEITIQWWMAAIPGIVIGLPLFFLGSWDSGSWAGDTPGCAAAIGGLIAAASILYLVFGGLARLWP